MRKIILIITISFVILSVIVILFKKEQHPSLNSNVFAPLETKFLMGPTNISKISPEIKSAITTNIKINEEEKPGAEEPKKEGEIKKLARQNETNWQWVERQKKLYQLSPTEINLILKELELRFPKKSERLKALAILRIGTPYQLGPLGEESGRDKDPIFRLDAADCTVFVLTTVALLHSQNLDEAKEMMKFLNYRPNSEITFENRLHFTTDRNITSPYFQDITEEIAGQNKTKEKIVTLNKTKADGKRLIDIDWEKEIALKYIPNEYITKELFQNLPKAIGIAFIKEGDEKIGLDVRHEGILFEGKLLFQASSVRGKVVSDDFFEYYFVKKGEPRFDGITFFEIK